MLHLQLHCMDTQCGQPGFGSGVDSVEKVVCALILETIFRAMTSIPYFGGKILRTVLTFCLFLWLTVLAQEE